MNLILIYKEEFYFRFLSSVFYKNFDYCLSDAKATNVKLTVAKG